VPHFVCNFNSATMFRTWHLILTQWTDFDYRNIIVLCWRLTDHLVHGVALQTALGYCEHKTMQEHGLQQNVFPYAVSCLCFAHISLFSRLPHNIQFYPYSTLPLEWGWWWAPRHAPRCPGTETRAPSWNRRGGTAGPVWTGAENVAPTGVRTPDSSARTKFIYRLNVSHKAVKVPRDRPRWPKGFR
jgi:hypothetical protein